jgi:hypothetical protein
MSAILAAIAYVIDITVALFIRSTSVFLAWEEGFVITCFVFARLASFRRVRAYVWSEYKRQKAASPATPSSHRQRMICKMCAYAQTNAGNAAVFILSAVRLCFRAIAFEISPVLIIETTCEACGAFVAAVLALAYVMDSGEKRNKSVELA